MVDGWRQAPIAIMAQSKGRVVWDRTGRERGRQANKRLCETVARRITSEKSRNPRSQPCSDKRWSSRIRPVESPEYAHQRRGRIERANCNIQPWGHGPTDDKTRG